MMKTTTQRRQRPPWGRKLAARRVELDLTLAAVEEITDGIVYAQLLFRLENGLTKPGNLKVHQLAALLSALEWTVEDWNSALGTELGGGLGTKANS